MSKFYCFKTLSCCHAVWIQIRTYNLGPNYLHGMMYAVIEWGGGLLCPSCKIQRGGGGLCPSCKIHRGGDYVLVVKFMGGILSTYTKMSRRGFVRGGGGFCPTLVDKWPGNKLATGPIIWIPAHINTYKSFFGTYENSVYPYQTPHTWNQIRVSTVCLPNFLI